MYAHSKQELRSTGAFHKTKLCRFMQTGHCTLGAKCNFAHSAVELREPETLEGLDELEGVDSAPPPGLEDLGIENMISDLLSDDDDEDTKERRPPPGLPDASRRLEPPKLPPPPFMPLGPPSDPWSFGNSIIPETLDRGDPMKPFKDAEPGAEALWNVQNLFAAADSAPAGFPALGGGYAAEGGSLPYGGTLNDFSSPWGSDALTDQYNSLIGHTGNAWDWQVFGENAVMDQKDDLKMKSGFAQGGDYLQQASAQLWQESSSFNHLAIQR